jgi:hypothetical protein
MNFIISRISFLTIQNFTKEFWTISNFGNFRLMQKTKKSKSIAISYTKDWAIVNNNFIEFHNFSHLLLHYSKFYRRILDSFKSWKFQTNAKTMDKDKKANIN